MLGEIAVSACARLGKTGWKFKHRWGGGKYERRDVCILLGLNLFGGRFLVQPEGKDVAVMLVNQSKCGDCGQKAKAGDNVRISEQVNISLVFVCFVCLVFFFFKGFIF